MHQILQIFYNPAIISLIGGILIGHYSRFKIPQKAAELISTYLVFSIGFKGGFSFIAKGNQQTILLLFSIGIFIGFIQPFINYFILKKATKLDNENLSVIAAQYGSISIVTFLACLKFLTEKNIPFDPFMIALAGIMELPALFSGLWLLHGGTKSTNIKKIVQAIFGCKKIMFIFLGFFVGLIANKLDLDCFQQTLLWPFNFALILFMFDIGIKIASQLEQINKINASLIAFGICSPIIYGTIGLAISKMIGLSVGSALLFAILLASASYIAVPAVFRSQAPNASEAIYLPLSLAITLPFNIIIGIPFFYFLFMQL